MKLFNKKIIIAISILSILLLIYLILPAYSDKYTIVFDREQMERKRVFLTRLGQTLRPKVRRPNIVLILTDDLGKTDISLYGGKSVQTPNIDAIGSEGVTFTDAYCSSPICSPSRAGLLTGRYQQRFGHEVQPGERYPSNPLTYYIAKYFIFNSGDWRLSQREKYPSPNDIPRQGIPPTEILLSELLKSDGYSTGIIGKWHLGHREPFVPRNRGFEYQYGFYEAFTLYSPEGRSDIVDYHGNYFADRHMWSQGRNENCAILRNGAVIDEKEYLTTKIGREAEAFIEDHRVRPFFLYLPFNAPHAPFQAEKKYYDRFAGVKEKNRRVYYAMIASLDDAVGGVMKKIRDLGLEENTIVIFASDNGGATYTGATDNAPLKGGKFSDFEGGINIPLMIRWKGSIRPGSSYANPVSLIDLFTTAAAAARCPLPEDRAYDGVNLLPYVSGAIQGKPHRVLFWRRQHNKAVRKDNWKLILNDRYNWKLLYDLSNDRSEKNNVIQEHPEIAADLMRELSEWEKTLRDPLWPSFMEYRFTYDGKDYQFSL